MSDRSESVKAAIRAMIDVCQEMRSARREMMTEDERDDRDWLLRLCAKFVEDNTP